MDNEEEAQVVWSTRHLKDFPKYANNENVQIINQFPNEKVLTCKDLLYEMCKLYVGITVYLLIYLVGSSNMYSLYTGTMTACSLSGSLRRTT